MPPYGAQPQYDSEIERIASQGIAASQQRMHTTQSMIRSYLRANRAPRGFRTPVNSPRRKGPVQAGPPVGMNNGLFPKGVMDPLRNYSITSPYGMRINPVTGEHSMHEGIDLAAPQGTPVRASFSGRIRRAGWEDIDGNMIMIGHGRGWKTSYSHLARILVRQGQFVRKGQIIGYVGSTGRSTGPHLHWMVYRRGRDINPRRFL
jgi:murein DD-endopeptidase MepM/ murein hydrolase activator NlpD